MNLRRSRKLPFPFVANDHKENNQAKFLLRIFVPVNKNSSGSFNFFQCDTNKSGWKNVLNKTSKITFSSLKDDDLMIQSTAVDMTDLCLNGDGANAPSNELNERFGNFHALHKFSKLSKMYCLRLI